jgi:glycosyltransferase involved in cell wall biosynthesis
MGQRRIDLLHAHEFAMNTYGSLASLLGRTKVVATVHGKSYYAEKLRRRLAYRWVSRRARMVAVSEDIKNFLVEKVGVEPRRILTIYNGIDHRGYELGPETRRAVREELGIGEDQPVIGAVGSLYPVKGHTHLIKAASIVLRSFAEPVFLIAGGGSLLEGLRAEAAALGITDRVRFLGFREDIPRILQAIDIYTMPSLSEGLPLSALEAMASRRPVIASRVGGIPEVVLDGATGYLVPVENHGSLAARILDLLRDPALARRLGETGKRRVVEVFSLSTMMQRYQELYERLC